VTVETTLAAQAVLTLRVYAITSKNRVITSCLCVVTVSQFILGLYLTTYAATRGANHTDPTSGLHDMRVRGTQGLGNRIYCHVSRIRPFGLLSHRLSRGTVQRKQGPDSETAQGNSTGCDVVFPGYIHFASRARDVSVIRKSWNEATPCQWKCRVPPSDDHATTALTQEGRCFARIWMEPLGVNYAHHYEIW